MYISTSDLVWSDSAIFAEYHGDFEDTIRQGFCTKMLHYLLYLLCIGIDGNLPMLPMHMHKNYRISGYRCRGK